MDNYSKKIIQHIGNAVDIIPTIDDFFGEPNRLLSLKIMEKCEEDGINVTLNSIRVQKEYVKTQFLKSDANFFILLSILNNFF